MLLRPSLGRFLASGSLSIIALVGIASCGGDGTTEPPRPPPVAPTQVGTIPNQIIATGQTATLDIVFYFNDPDGGPLTYAAASSAAGVVSVAVSGGALTLVGVAAGTATVTVTATDPDGLTAAQGFQVTVEKPNQTPEAVGTIPAQTVGVGQTTTLDVAGSFRDPDGNALTYTAASSAAGVVTVSMSGSTLTLVGVTAGTATVTVTATDPDGLTAAQGFQVTVEKPNQTPEAVGTIPAQTVGVGQTTTLDVAGSFRDPDGNALTYTAASSAAGVVTVSMSGSTLTLVGVTAGTATVTVTAADPAGLTTAQGFQVTVGRPNRAPEAVGTIPAQTVGVGQAATLDVASSFRDPDGDALTYTAASSAVGVVTVSMSGSTLVLVGVTAGTATVTVTAADPAGLTTAQSIQATAGAGPSDRAPAGVVTVSVSGGTLTLVGVTAGTATVTVTAADPAGLTATQRMSVTVEILRPGFRDDFDSAASLRRWALSNATASVSEGFLYLTATSEVLGMAHRSVGRPLTEWTIQVRAGRSDGEGYTQLYWETADPNYPTFLLTLIDNPSQNWAVCFFSSREDKWICYNDINGHSANIRTGTGELTDITVRHDGERVIFMADSEVVRTWLPAQEWRDALRTLTRVWVGGYPDSLNPVFRFDFVDVAGTEIGADRSGGAYLPPGIDQVPDALQAAAGSPGRVGGVSGIHARPRDR